MRASRFGRIAGRTTAGLLCALVLVACGDDGSSTAEDPDAGSSPSDTGSSGSTSADPSGDPSESAPSDPGPTGDQVDWPACGRVWREGATLEKSYAGCLDAGRAVRPQRLPCSSGQKLFTYDDRYWATAGGTISKADGKIWKDQAYKRVERICLG